MCARVGDFDDDPYRRVDRSVLQDGRDGGTEVLQRQRTLGGALADIAEAATSSVPGCDAASIAISIGGRAATAAITARVALELDLVQYDLDEGPCLTTYRTMSNLRIDLVEQSSSFPHFAVAAQARGVRGVLSIPATWGHDVVGTLNLYSRTDVRRPNHQVTTAHLLRRYPFRGSRPSDLVGAASGSWRLRMRASTRRGLSAR